MKLNRFYIFEKPHQIDDIFIYVNPCSMEHTHGFNSVQSFLLPFNLLFNKSRQILETNGDGDGNF